MTLHECPACRTLNSGNSCGKCGVRLYDPESRKKEKTKRSIVAYLLRKKEESTKHG